MAGDGVARGKVNVDEWDRREVGVFAAALMLAIALVVGALLVLCFPGPADGCEPDIVLLDDVYYCCTYQGLMEDNLGSCYATSVEGRFRYGKHRQPNEVITGCLAIVVNYLAEQGVTYNHEAYPLVTWIEVDEHERIIKITQERLNLEPSPK